MTRGDHVIVQVYIGAVRQHRIADSDTSHGKLYLCVLLYVRPYRDCSILTFVAQRPTPPIYDSQNEELWDGLFIPEL